MPTKYFEHLPVITYAGKQTRDLTRSVKIPDSITANPYSFYPYQLTHGDRPDKIANAYYDDPYMVWMVYLSNKVVDPYYDWFLGDEELNNHVTNKYGSIAAAQRRIMMYRVNWYDDDSKITISDYQNLAAQCRKYWAPVNDEVGYPMFYERKQVDWSVNTNRLYTLSVDTHNELVTADLVTIYVGATPVGFAEVDYSDDSIVTLKNTFVTQDISNKALSIVADLESPTRSGTFTDANLVQSNGTAVGIPDVELLYWAPVTAWDVETENNANNGTIRLLDKSVATQATEALNQAFSG